MKAKELWLLNTTRSDVSLGDLAVKVWAGKTVNLYALSPYLTEEQVNKSMKEGSLKKRTDSGVLKVVKGNTKKVPDVVKKIQESKQPVLVRKTKSSIVVEHTDTEVTEGDKLEFADYGLGDLESEVSKEKGTIVVQAKQDETPELTPETELKPKVDNTLNNQSAVVMEAQKKGLNNPVGKLGAPSTSANQPFVVTPPSDTEKVEEVQVTKPDVAKSGDTVLVGQKQQVRSLKNIAAEQKGEDVEPTIKMEKADIDARVATKTEKGAIVMEIKEVPPETKKEARPKKVKKKDK